MFFKWINWNEKISRPNGFRITILSMIMTNQKHRIVYLIPGPLNVTMCLCCLVKRFVYFTNLKLFYRDLNQFKIFVCFLHLKKDT